MSRHWRGWAEIDVPRFRLSHHRSGKRLHRGACDCLNDPAVKMITATDALASVEFSQLVILPSTLPGMRWIRREQRRSGGRANGFQLRQRKERTFPDIASCALSPRLIPDASLGLSETCPRASEISRLTFRRGGRSALDFLRRARPFRPSGGGRGLLRRQPRRCQQRDGRCTSLRAGVGPGDWSDQSNTFVASANCSLGAMWTLSISSRQQSQC